MDRDPISILSEKVWALLVCSVYCGIKGFLISTAAGLLEVFLEVAAHLLSFSAPTPAFYMLTASKVWP